MKYIATTISDFIISEMRTLRDDPQSQSREMRIMLPSLPARVILQVGKALEEYRLHQSEDGSKIELIYKSAFSLREEWRKSSLKAERAAGREIEENDWYDKENHLTKWRNVQLKNTEEDMLVIVLIGYDRVTDQSSLEDFFRLDYPVVWKRNLGGSFSRWIESRLKEKPVEFEDQYVSRMDQLLRGLVQSSLADIIGISEFLERIDLSHAMDGRDALRAMVGQLTHFNLPSMIGLVARRQKRTKGVAHYLSNAVEFFNYSKYLDHAARNKALSKVDKFMDQVDLDNFDLEVLGNYQTIGSDVQGSLACFAADLKSYIASNDSAARKQLQSVDFVFLLDDVLGAKKKGPSVSKKPKKLTGLPLEVVLRAIWLTFGEFKKWAIERNLLATEALTDIEIQGDLFKHDCDGDDAGELAQNAQQLLIRLIGGLDSYLGDQLAFAADPINDPERMVRVKSRLCPAVGEGTLGYERAKSSEPYLKFTVAIAAEEGAIKRQFIWRLPQLHPYRTMAGMFEWFYNHMVGNPIPVFCIPYFEELMLAKDEEEVHRIFQLALQDSESPEIFNVLDAHGIDNKDNTVPLLSKLGYEYARFIGCAHQHGLFKALEDFTSVENACREVYSTFLHDSKCMYSQVGPLLFKAFFVLGERRDAEGTYWMWRAHEPSLAITPLHPALLEMLFHQHAYLCESFVVAVRQGLRESGTKWFSRRRWADIEDLAQIQWPLHGTLRNEEKILDTNVRSFGLIHLVGESPQEESTLTTRLLLRYDSNEDDEITDEELFKATRESRLVQRVLEDYRKLSLHADDGLAIAAYCSTDVQSLVAGVDGFLAQVFKERDQNRPYTFSLTLFAESQDDTTITRWVREWRERWEAAEPAGKRSYYRNCRMSVAHRMITREHNYAQFVNLLRSVDVDIAFLFQFVRAGTQGNRFQKTEPYDHSGSFRMFPVLEKMCCSVIGGGQEHTRERIISNRQFKLGTLHSGVMARLKDITDREEFEYVVLGRGDFSPWRPVVNELHKRSAWVVCVDPSVDEHLIARKNRHGNKTREIIGFGSGVGAHGEYNYTVSTEEYSLAGVRKRVAAHVAAKLGPWSGETCEQIAECVTKEAAHMAGMSLVKATGPSEYVRDFIAYALVRKLLHRDPEAFCDEVVSLDAFKHWFDSAPSGKRPDLVHMKAKIVDGTFEVSAQLIECKLAQESDRHLQKAREQLENGLGHLIACFKPRQTDTPEGIDDRPDQRYWWLQLHRLLASKGQVPWPQVTSTITALEKMSDGIFSIRWSAAAVTFWTDSDRKDIRKEDEWEFQFEGMPLPIQVVSAGRRFVRALCTHEVEQELPVDSAAHITFGVPLPGDGESGEKNSNDKDFDHAAGVKKSQGEDADPAAGHGDHDTGEGENEPLKPVPPEPPSVPERIFLGKGSKGGMDVYWEFGHPELANRHMLIFGTSGMGKTYTIQALLCELGRRGQNSLIVDYTDGFHDNQLENETKEFLKPTQHIVKVSKVPINPFRRQHLSDSESLLEDPPDTAQRVAGVFSEVYGLGDQQKSAVYSSVKRGVDLYGDQLCLSRLPELILDIAKDSMAVSSSASSVISKLQPFVDMNPFGQEDPESWEKLFGDSQSRCHVLQLTGYLRDAAKLITEFSLIDLYWYYRTRGQKDRPKVIVLDEIQNLDRRLESPLGKFLTEGRKFGISLIMATQTLSSFQKEERDRLFQAAHKLFFRPAETEIKSYAQILESATHQKAEEWVHRLSSLKKGECYSLGPILNPDTEVLQTKAFRIKIASLTSRF